MKYYKQLYQSQKGMVIPVVLIIFFAMLILGVAGLHLSGADQRISIYQSQKMQAYYLAQSGAESLAESLYEQSTVLTFEQMKEKIDAINGQSTGQLVNVAGVQGSQLVLTTKVVDIPGITDEKRLVIESTAKYGSTSQTVKLNMYLTYKTTTGGYDPQTNPYALVALGGENQNNSLLLDLTGDAVVGDVMVSATRGKIEFSNWGTPIAGRLFAVDDIDMSVKHDRSRDPISMIADGHATSPIEAATSFPLPVFPDIEAISLPSRSVETFGSEYRITQDGDYGDQLRLSGGGKTITIDLGGGNRYIMLDELDISGGGTSLVLTNAGDDGKLYLYVDQKMKFGSSSLNWDGDPDQLQIYFNGGVGGFEIGNDNRMNGNLFFEGNSGTLNLQGGMTLNGNIVTNVNNVAVGNNISLTGMIYAPKGSVDINGGTITGSIVADKVTINNGGIVVYSTTSVVPGEFFGSEGENKTLEVKYDENPWQ